MEECRMPTLKMRLHVCLAVATAAVLCLAASARAQRRGGGLPLPDDPTEAIQTLNGFRVSLVQRSDPQKHGSWISMNKDERGRLILGGQRGQPLTRLTLQDGKVVKEEVLHLPVSEVMGILPVGDALYVNGAAQLPSDPADAGGRGRGGAGAGGPGGAATGPATRPAARGQGAAGAGGAGGGRGGGGTYGLYRLRDPAGDGSFSSVERLRTWERGSGEHGAHAILLAPDKKHLVVVVGNQVGPQSDASPDSPMRNFADDRAIPRREGGFMAGERPPGGTIYRMDLDGKNVE